MHSAVQALLNILDLETIKKDCYQGASIDIGTGRVYGGQVVAQAIIAASRTFNEVRQLHSLHTYFLRPGDVNLPIFFEVERVRDGASFTTRHVRAVQADKELFTGIFQFHVSEDGPEHQCDMPVAPSPDDLLPDRVIRHALSQKLPSHLSTLFQQERAIEFRLMHEVNMFMPQKGQKPSDCLWMRVGAALSDDPIIHQACVAYMSDFALVHTIMRPHGLSVLHPHVQSASLDHSMWFHQAMRADEWLLYIVDSSVALGARGLAQGKVFSQNGNLVSSVAQEALIRLLEQ